MITQIKKEELNERVTNTLLGITEPNFAILGIFRLSEIDNKDFKVKYFTHHKLNNANYNNGDYITIPDKNNYVFDSMKSVYSDDNRIGNALIKEKYEKGDLEKEIPTKLKFLYTFNNSSCNSIRSIRFENNGSFSYENEVHSNNPSVFSSSNMRITQNGKLKNDLVYILFSKDGVNFYTEESPDKNEFNLVNFFNKDKEALRTFEIKRYENNDSYNKLRFKYEKPSNSGFIMPLDEQAENIYNHSSLSTETYELDDDGNLIKYKSNLFEKKDGKYYCINGEKSNIINIPEYAGVNTMCDYLQNWLELYNLGKEENVSKKIAPGYLESNIYNKTKDELTYLLTVNDVLSRTIVIKRNSSNDCFSSSTSSDYFGVFSNDQISDIFSIEYRDSVGYVYTLQFAYNRSTKRIIPRFTYICNDFSMIYDITNKNILYFSSQYLTKKDVDHIRLRDIYGIPRYKID